MRAGARSPRRPCLRFAASNPSSDAPPPSFEFNPFAPSAVPQIIAYDDHLMIQLCSTAPCEDALNQSNTKEYWKRAVQTSEQQKNVIFKAMFMSKRIMKERAVQTLE
ncbi:hypothetical protein C4D60_Mb08t28830 [Musa balbisiana]|uniref:Uncharacterized protein n=1 Tax=Musa balbisiana TaxID=52838 RepID=A0A4S8K779_MUSBA|nr:hypothetical protein C4D60_Mb08t28830 [Musa balbisiana]